jgi:hypothetical protein
MVLMNETDHASNGQFLLTFYRNLRRMGMLLIVLPLLILIVITVNTTLNNTQAQPDYSKIGIHVMLDDGRNRWDPALWEAHLAYAAQVTAPGAMIVQVIRADDLDAERWQLFLTLAQQFDLQPVFRLATTFDRSANWWTAPDPAADGSYTAWGERYRDFLLALDWGATIPQVIVLNEPNNGHEWGGRPDPAGYARFAADVTDVLRAGLPEIRIMNAALDLYAPHTGSAPFPDSDLYHIDANSYLDALFSADPQFFTRFDYWNSHAYTRDFSAAPYVQDYGFDFIGDAAEATVAPPEGIYNRGVNGYVWELWKLEQFGVPLLPVVLTEVGWRHSAEGYPDARTAAQYLDVALRGRASIYINQPLNFTPWLLDERVIAVVPFALNGVPEEWQHSNWLVMDAGGQITGTTALFDLIQGYPLGR